MDVSTDSDTSEDVLIRSETQDIHVKTVPAIVTWRTANDQSQCLEHLNFVLVYKNETKQALIRLQTCLKVRRDPAKPSIFLLIKPHEVARLECIRTETDDLLSAAEREQCREARQKLCSSAYALRFKVRVPPTFIVPKRQSFASFRAGSQSTWRSWQSFIKDTHQFMIHFPSNSLPKTRLLSFCQAATGSGLTSLNDEVAGLYGGEGGRIVDPDEPYDDDSANARTITAAEDGDTIANDAPPAYNERVAAGPSMSAIEPPLCLSPRSVLQPDRKRRRGASNSDLEAPTSHNISPDASHLILQSLARLQQIVEKGQSEHGTILTEILAQMTSMEGRISRLENQQHDLSKELETCVEPLWDELSARLQSQEDREHDYMRDIAEDVFGEKIDERMDERIPEALDSYFRNGDDGHTLVSEVVGEKIQEETREFLRRQCFTTHITITENE